jgi:hypothetical protein
MPAQPFGLLLVEGGDERAVCEAVAGPATWANLICWKGKGRNDLDEVARLAKLDANYSHARAVGVVLDVEESLVEAQNIVSRVFGKFGAAFQGHGAFSQTSPPIGAFISPNGMDHGSIESLCRRAVRSPSLAACVDQFVICSGSPHANLLNAQAKSDKAWLNAYLSMLPDPSLRFYQAFSSADGIDPMHSAFDDLRAFLQSL